MHQLGWLSERGGNFLNLLQKEGGTQKGGVPSEKGGGFQPWRKLCDQKNSVKLDLQKNGGVGLKS